jgi:hypothetical protein
MEMPSMANRKGRSSLNALVHGAYAKDLVLPGEDQEEFKALLREFVRDLQPEGAVQESVVLEIVRLNWQKRRWERAYRKKFIVSPTEARLVELGFELVDNIDAAIKKVTISYSVLSDKATIAKDLAEGPLLEMGATVQKKLLLGLFELRSAADEIIFPKGRAPPLDDPDWMERLLAISGLFDARIDKALARLVGLKEYKRLYGPKRQEAEVLDQASLIPGPDPVGAK